MRNPWCSATTTLCLLGSLAVSLAQTPVNTLQQLPIREVTVFKDGNAFVQHAGTVPTDAAGDVVLDYLPTPVLGTFWPYATGAAKLSAVVVGQRRVPIERTALTLRDFLEANVGAAVQVTEAGVAAPYAATILTVPYRDAEEVERTEQPNGGDSRLPEKGNTVVLQTADGVRIMPIDRIVTITLAASPKTMVVNDEFRNVMTLKLDWSQTPAAAQAGVGMIYLQNGLRWIPEYKLDLDKNGKATLRLQAALVNDLADLNDVTAHLVVGVPAFAFRDQLDPIALQQAAAQVSARMRDAQTAYGFSNAIRSQVTGGARFPIEADNYNGEAGGPHPAVAGAGKAEDLFIFTVNHITLKKGQRMVLPVATYPLTYEDVYTLDIPVAPPVEFLPQYGSNQQAELARMMAAPKVMHKIRLKNTAPHPFTTAPMLMMQNGTVLAQGLMTYTPLKGQVDVELSPAIDITVKKTDRETGRVDAAKRILNNDYMRVNLTGTLTLTNHGHAPITVEVNRYIMGDAGATTPPATIEQINVYENTDYAIGPSISSWPYWWSQANGIDLLRWNSKLAPGVATELKYDWSYYFRP